MSRRVTREVGEGKAYQLLFSLVDPVGAKERPWILVP
jgi:hypothetical protein